MGIIPPVPKRQLYAPREPKPPSRLETKEKSNEVTHANLSNNYISLMSHSIHIRFAIFPLLSIMLRVSSLLLLLPLLLLCFLPLNLLLSKALDSLLDPSFLVQQILLRNGVLDALEHAVDRADVVCIFLVVAPARGAVVLGL